MQKSHILFFLLLFSSVLVVGQNNTSSPYSMFGIGEIEANKSARTIAIGGTGIAVRSEYFLNSQNPASYCGIDSQMFILDAGLQMKQALFTYKSLKQTNNSTNLSNLALGFRFTSHWATSFSISPYSSVGYKINTHKTVEGTEDKFDILTEGSGGVNRASWGNSFKFLKNRLALGVNLSYLFGNITQTETSSGNLFAGTIVTTDNIHVSNPYITYGLQYRVLERENFKFTLGGVYGYKTGLNLEKSETIVDNSGSTLADNVLSTGTYYIPTFYGFGLACELHKNTNIYFDYKKELWGESGNVSTTNNYTNSTEYRLGAEIIPSLSFKAAYFKKIQYRVGVYNKSSYIKIAEGQLQNYGASCGLGLPLDNGRYYLNISYQYGFYGIFNSSNVINQNYHLISLSLNFLDIWFAKTKFD